MQILFEFNSLRKSGFRFRTIGLILLNSDFMDNMKNDERFVDFKMWREMLLR